jgi:GNAT superfamily N-acetyltransferase
MVFEELDVSKFTEEDTKVYTRLAFDCWVELWPDKPINIDFERLGRMVGTGLATMVVAKDNEGVIMGYQLWEHYAIWLEKGQNVSSLKAIYVKPQYRNLVNAVRFVEWAKQLYLSRGAGKIICVVDDGNEQIASVVRKCGFKPIAQVFEV